MNNKKTVTFVLPLTSQPRYVKRIDAFKNCDYEYIVFSFERDYFEGTQTFPFISLGKIDHGKYFKRILILIRALKILLKERKTIENSSFIFTFGLDNLILVTVLLRILKIHPHVIYEVADIREIMFKDSLKSRVFKSLEKLFLKKADTITITSPYYLNNFYLPKLNVEKEKFFVIENKLLSPVPASPKPIFKEKFNKIKIGYFGLLRCQRSWDLLYNLAKAYPDDIEIYIRGYIMNLDNFETSLNELGNITYDGEYKSPDDLGYIYNKIDFSLIGNISNNIENGKLALPNRFYESLYYKTPMIAHEGSAVANEVNKLGVGLKLNFNNIESSIREIINVDMHKYNEFIDNTNVNEDITIGDEDHRKLIRRLEDSIQ